MALELENCIVNIPQYHQCFTYLANIYKEGDDTQNETAIYDRYILANFNNTIIIQQIADNLF